MNLAKVTFPNKCKCAIISWLLHVKYLTFSMHLLGLCVLRLVKLPWRLTHWHGTSASTRYRSMTL